MPSFYVIIVDKFENDSARVPGLHVQWLNAKAREMLGSLTSSNAHGTLREIAPSSAAGHELPLIGCNEVHGCRIACENNSVAGGGDASIHRSRA